jgi:hypothetical protein
MTVIPAKAVIQSMTTTAFALWTFEQARELRNGDMEVKAIAFASILGRLG